MVGTDTGTRLCQARRPRGCSTSKGSSSKTVCCAGFKAAIAAGDPALGSTRFLPEQHEGLQSQAGHWDTAQTEHSTPSSELTQLGAAGDSTEWK